MAASSGHAQFNFARPLDVAVAKYKGGPKLCYLLLMERAGHRPLRPADSTKRTAKRQFRKKDLFDTFSVDRLQGGLGSPAPKGRRKRRFQEKV